MGMDGLLRWEGRREILIDYQIHSSLSLLVFLLGHGFLSGWITGVSRATVVFNGLLKHLTQSILQHPSL